MRLQAMAERSPPLSLHTAVALHSSLTLWLDDSHPKSSLPTLAETWLGAFAYPQETAR